MSEAAGDGRELAARVITPQQSRCKYLLFRFPRLNHPKKVQQQTRLSRVVGGQPVDRRGVDLLGLLTASRKSKEIFTKQSRMNGAAGR